MLDLQKALQPLITSKRTTTPTTVGNGGISLFGGISTKNGVPVNEKTALQLSAFYNAIDIITNDFAKLPKAVFQKTDKGRIKISNHNVQYLIAKRPNQYMSSFSFNKLMLMNAILKGNAYAFVERNQNTAKPIALQLIDQDKTPVTVLKHNSKLYYRYDGKTVPSEDMLHVPGFSYNGITGISVIQHAAKSLGVSLSSQEFSEDYYTTKGVGTAVVTTPKAMDPDAKTRYSSALGSTLDRSGNWKVAVIDEGGSFQHLKITPQEAMFLSTNKYGIEEVARWLNIPPHKLKSLDNVNNSITENLEIQHVADSILPWAIKFDLEYEVKLFTAAEQNGGFYIKSNEGALLRADKKTQAEYFSKLIFSGVYTRNEVRQLLDLNGLDGLDEPLTPVNTQTMQQIDENLKNTKND